MIAGPTQLRPMYWAPRGSWWAHISSRTTVWSHTEPPAAAVLGGPGEGEEALLGEGLAEPLGHVEVGGIAGERAEVVLRDVLSDQRSEPDPQGGGRLAEVEVHGALHVRAEK